MRLPLLAVCVAALSITANATSEGGAVEYVEIVREASRQGQSTVEGTQPPAKENARWTRLVDIDHELFREKPIGKQLLFSPQPDLTYFVEYTFHRDYPTAHGGVGWSGNLNDSNGAWIGQFSAVSAANGYLRIRAQVGGRTFIAVSIADRTAQVLYEVDHDDPSIPTYVDLHDTVTPEDSERRMLEYLRSKGLIDDQATLEGSDQ